MEVLEGYSINFFILFNKYIFNKYNFISAFKLLPFSQHFTQRFMQKSKCSNECYNSVTWMKSRSLNALTLTFL